LSLHATTHVRVYVELEGLLFCCGTFCFILFSSVLSFYFTGPHISQIAEERVTAGGHFAHRTVRLSFGNFAYWTLRLLVISSTRHFAYGTHRLQDISPTLRSCYLAYTLKCNKIGLVARN